MDGAKGSRGGCSRCSGHQGIGAGLCRGADLNHGDRHRRAAGHPPGLLNQRGGAGPTGEGHHQHRDRAAGSGVGLGAGNSELEQLAIADRPGGAAVPLPLGRQHQRRPAQLTGGAGDRGIGTTGPAMEQEVHQTATTASQELSGNALMGPGQIPATASGDHQRATRAGKGPRG